MIKTIALPSGEKNVCMVIRLKDLFLNFFQPDVQRSFIVLEMFIIERIVVEIAVNLRLIAFFESVAVKITVNLSIVVSMLLIERSVVEIAVNLRLITLFDRIAVKIAVNLRIIIKEDTQKRRCLQLSPGLKSPLILTGSQYKSKEPLVGVGHWAFAKMVSIHAIDI